MVPVPLLLPGQIMWKTSNQLSIAKMKSAIAILIAVLAMSATAKVLSTDLGEDASSSTNVPDDTSSTPPPEPETTPAGSQSISVTTSLVLSSVVLMKLCQ